MTTIARDPATLSPIEQAIAAVPDDCKEQFVASFYGGLSALERANLRYAWNAMWARPSQTLPTGRWNTWFVRAGRGAGKTRQGAEGVRRLVNDGQARAVTLIGPTAADARDVMIEGPESGLLAVHPLDLRPEYKPSVRTLEWPNGAIGHVRSAEEPDSLRGLNSDLVWGDEPASWKTGRAPWDNAMLGNRIGKPHAILTGTPRPLPWLKELEAEAGTILSLGTTYDNISNLAPEFVALILRRYEGTRLGAQELHARYLEDVEGAYWTQAVIDAYRIVTGWDVTDPWASLRLHLVKDGKIIKPDRRTWTRVVGVDPPGETAECGIVVATAPRQARYTYDHVAILDDLSVAGPPETWGAQVVTAFRRYDCHEVVVEANQGGDMCRSTIHAVDPTVPVRKLRPTESKGDRAEPVSVLSTRGLLHLVGYLGALESQLTTWVPAEAKSPDRLDAAVHAVTAVCPPTPTRIIKLGNPNARS